MKKIKNKLDKIKKECYNIPVMNTNTITYTTDVKVGNHKILIRKFKNETGWLIINRKGTWIGAIERDFGFGYHPFNELGDKLGDILLKRYPFGNAAQEFICEFCGSH